MGAGMNGADMGKVAVVIASKGRPDALGDWITHLRTQTVAPAVVLWCVTGPQDLPDLSDVPAEVHPQIIVSSAGSCRQRNRGLDAVPADVGLVAFFDDDYVPSRRCIANIIRSFAQHPDVAGINGTVIADGINGAGISLEEARNLVAGYDAISDPATIELTDCEGLYGCNMAFRMAAIGEERFDEGLPLYGWLEDVDFAARVSRRGRTCKTNGFTGVHRGIKHGRTSGKRFGYSQIANPIHLIRKGTGSPLRMARLMMGNIIANHVRALAPEPWVDRKGRVAGNWLGIWHGLRGCLSPERVAQL